MSRTTARELLNTLAKSISNKADFAERLSKILKPTVVAAALDDTSIILSGLAWALWEAGETGSVDLLDALTDVVAEWMLGQQYAPTSECAELDKKREQPKPAA